MTACLHVCLSACMHEHVKYLLKQVGLYTCVCVCVCVMLMYTCRWMHAQRHVNACTHLRMYKHLYVHTYANIHTSTHDRTTMRCRSIERALHRLARSRSAFAPPPASLVAGLLLEVGEAPGPRREMGRARAGLHWSVEIAERQGSTGLS